MPASESIVPLSRRAFLKFAAVNMAALAAPRLGEWPDFETPRWPMLALSDLPIDLQATFAQMPLASLDASGLLSVAEKRGMPAARAALIPTQWNREHNQRWFRLDSTVSWGIVLHWFGDPEDFDRTVPGYMRGFDSLRDIDGMMTRTSAHFLVGDDTPAASNLNDENKISLLQTQAPYAGGVPMMATHVLPVDILAHREKRQYFVRALYQLEHQGKAPHTLLQEMFDGRLVNPNMRTIAIEITGSRFDEPGNMPSTQKLANVLALVWALMRRYSIPATHILGHHEIQLGKSDPGKKFMALVRFLLGVKALLEQDENMLRLVFGAFTHLGNTPEQAVERYFTSVREYLVLTSTQREVYEWEQSSKYCFVTNGVSTRKSSLSVATRLILPVQASGLRILDGFLEPENHEGIDLYRFQANQVRTGAEEARLVAQGECLYFGKIVTCHPGTAAIFRHIESSGAQFLTVFSNISHSAPIEVGRQYPLGYSLGRIENHTKQTDPFLHFAVAYGATWDTDLSRNPGLPLNAGASWIRERYLNPWHYLQNR